MKVTTYTPQGMIQKPEKPFKGRLRNWTKLDPTSAIPLHRGVIIACYFVDHPLFKGEWGHTSRVVSIGPEDKHGCRTLETVNSKYLLVGKELNWDEYKAARILYEEGEQKAYRLLEIQHKKEENNVKPNRTVRTKASRLKLSVVKNVKR